MTKDYLFLLVLTTACLSIKAQKYIKSTVDIEPITIDKDSTATVLEWFKLIEKKGLVLSYNATDINLFDKVEINQNSYHIDKFLYNILRKYEFETIFFKKKILLQIKGPKKIQISGIIFDKTTKEPLEGCIVKLSTNNNRQFYAITDSNGTFHKNLPYDNYQLYASYIGYQPFKITYSFGKVHNIRIAMTQAAIPLNEVKVKNATMSDVVNYKGAFRMMSVNDNDPFAQIHTLPGIHGSSVNGDMHVNGGQSDENLILLDGISIYHSHHNNTLLAQFNGEAVEKVSFYDGFIPAQYEGRLSSVTDVKIKEGNFIEHHQSIGMDLPSVSLTLDGPIIKDKLTYMISGRHSWIDFMKDLFTDDAIASRTFKDLTAKLCYSINSGLSIKGLIYSSKDEYKDEYKDNINNFQRHKILGWDNCLYSLSSHAALPKGVSNISSISFSKYINTI